jgi:phosphoglycolate phosphatase
VTAGRPPFRAVLFDFDGTLADSFDAIAASVNHVRRGYGLPPLSVEQVKPNVGRGPERLLAETVPGGDPARDGREYRAHHPQVMRQLTRLLPGADRLTARLRQIGVLLAVCSNKPIFFTRSLLESLGVANRFAAVLGPEDVAHPKPAPDMLVAAFDRLNVKPSEALYIGDSAIDVNTGRAAGVVTWVVATGSDDRPALEAARPDRIFAGLGEIAALWPDQPLDPAAAGG